ncbi:MAG: TonB-dependent receptor domain-containing protein [Planctomycetota bacterium]
MRGRTPNSPTYAFSGDVAGGSDDFQYFVAGRWTFDDGPVGGSSLLGGGGPILETTGEGLQDNIRRMQGSAQFTLFPRDRLSFRLSTQFTDTNQHSPDTGNNIYAPLTLAAFGKPEEAFCNDGPTAGLGNGLCDGSGNPTGQVAFSTVREATMHGQEGNMEHFNFSLTGTYQATESLNFDLTFGLDATNQANSDFWPFAYDIDDFTNALDLGYKSAGRRNNREITMDARANWTERFGNISSQLVVGGQGFVSKNKTVFGDGETFPGPGLEVVGAAADTYVEEAFEENVNIGLLFQEQLGFNDWIYVTAGGRWDRNSAFGDSTTGQFYPKVSASIIPSDLPSWTSELVSSLRLRGAWGRSGQQPGSFDRFTTFESLTYATGPGLRPQNLGNPELKPEIAEEIEVGGEIGMLNNRAALELTYWNRKTRDALVSRVFPISGGFTRSYQSDITGSVGQLDNIGLLASSGYEIGFNALVMDKENVTIDFFANAAYLHEEIRDMGGAPPIKAGGTYTRYRNFLIGPDSIDVDCSAVTTTGGLACRDNVLYYAPGVHLGYRLIPTCDEGAVYYVGPRAGQARTCWNPGSEVPYDTNGDGQPDDIATFRSWIEANGPSLLLDDAPFGAAGTTGGAGGAMLVDDEDDDGDLQDNYLGKPTADWAGAFGANFTLWNNLQISTLFEYRTGDIWVNNLTDAFRQANPLIGRNIPQAARVESTIENPGASTDDKVDAAVEWATELFALRPVSGLNTIKNAKFLRWRELGISYTAPTSWTDKLHLDNLSFNLSVRNLALWTGYDGNDPESGAQVQDFAGEDFLKGIETFGAMIPRRFTFSLRFGF